MMTRSAKQQHLASHIMLHTRCLHQRILMGWGCVLVRGMLPSF